MKKKENRRWSKEVLANRETLIWEKKQGDLATFINVVMDLQYVYFIAGHLTSGEAEDIDVAAACTSREELTETLIMFSDMGFFCKIAKIDVAHLFDFNLN